MICNFFAKVEGETVIQYPINIRTEYSNISFPVEIDDTTLLPDGCVRVVPAAEPTVTSTTRNETQTPILVDGIWVQGWDVVELSVDELQDISECGYPRPF